VAGGHVELFAAGTRRMVHRYSGGIPRLINVLCDRALLGAYAQGTRRVTTHTIRRAAREALRGDNKKNWISAFYSKPQPAKPAASRAATGGGQRRIRPGLMLTSSLMGLSLIGLGFWLPQTTQTPAVTPSSGTVADRTLPKPQPPRAEPLIASTPPSAPPTAPISSPVATTPDLIDILRQNRGDDSNQQLLAIWGVTQQIPKTKVAFCEWVKTQNLRCLMGQDDWNMLRRFNHPVVLQLTVGGRPTSVLLRTLVEDTATLEIAGQTLTVPLAQLTPLWSGQYLLLWRSQIDLLLIGPGNTGEAVLWLRRRLALAAGQAAPEPLSTTFDKALGEQLRIFQRDQGLQADGMAGGRTLVLLNNLALAPDTPVLHPATQDR
ncbi:MAG: peptidoglycan-binding protein, partial [Phycisphaerales bacterium]|nr:peptidoglycan-binding protein [Phycisphaerales bacterium]